MSPREDYSRKLSLPQGPLPTAPETSWKRKLVRFLALLLVVALTVYIYTIRDQAEQLARYGYPGIFLLSLLANATVLLPAPGIAVVFAMGAIFHPLGVAVAAGAGSALGELSGYLAGFSGQAVAEQTATYQRLQRWMRRNGPVTIFLLALIPNPMFDLAGVIAGALRMPLHQFLLWTFPGKFLKMVFFAYAGAGLISAFPELFK